MVELLLKTLSERLFSFVIAIEPLISEPRGESRSGGGCLFQRRASRARDEERERDRRESSRLLVSQANVSTVLFLDASYWSRKAETGLCQQTGSKSPPAEGSLASPDASPGIATWRSQPCVRRCSFGALRLIPLFPTRSQPAHPNPGLLVFLTTCILELATELLQVITGFTAFKRTAAFSVNGSMIWDGQR